jgi:uncharacterized membrane protein YdjX (TVP38/TMEM64 family)
MNPRALLIPLLIVAIVLTAIFLPVEQLLMEIQYWAEENESSAMFIVGMVLVFGILLMLPMSLMLMLTGFLFGLAQGFAVAWLAGLLASTLAFLIGRSLARPWLERKIHRKTIFIAIDRAIKRKGFEVVLLTRLVMVLPYPATNYSLGLTDVSLRDFILGTNIGMIPPIILFVYLGTTVSDIAAIVSGELSLDRNEWVFGLLGLAAVIAIIAFIMHKAGVVLREELNRASRERLKT